MRGFSLPVRASKSKERGAGVYIGQGINRWSNVHIDDLIDLYILALEKAPSGAFFFAENGEESYQRIAQSISKSLGFGGKTKAGRSPMLSRNWVNQCALRLPQTAACAAQMPGGCFIGLPKDRHC